jgi:hypothetical protein
MNIRRSPVWSSTFRIVTAAAAAAVIALPLTAQTQEEAASARQVYRQDRADCLAGRTTQSRADCLYEARSALRDRLHGDPQLDDANEGNAGASSGARFGESADTAPLPPRADRN